MSTPGSEVVARGEAAARYAKQHGVALAEAARHFDISRERVRQKWREIYGAAPTPPRRVQMRRATAISALASRGLSAAEISTELEINLASVCRVRDRLGIEMIRHDDKIAVTPETRAMIRELASTGRSRAEIAHETGATYSVVTKYLVGHSTRGQRTHRGRSAMASAVMDATGCTLQEAAARFVVSPPDALRVPQAPRSADEPRCLAGNRLASQASHELERSRKMPPGRPSQP